jgi:hypothetical protein
MPELSGDSFSIALANAVLLAAWPVLSPFGNKHLASLRVSAPIENFAQLTSGAPAAGATRSDNCLVKCTRKEWTERTRA